MHADHRTHALPVADLIEQCAVLVRQPERHAAVATRLHALAVQLATELESHMEFEEQTVFPVLRTLPPPERDAILAAMRQRRAGSLGER
jgi:iron-sulfur cluster repair protein YtfE (RIC family)